MATSASSAFLLTVLEALDQSTITSQSFLSCIARALSSTCSTPGGIATSDCLIPRSDLSQPRAPLLLSLRGGGPPPCRAHANRPTLFPAAWWGSTARRAARIRTPRSDLFQPRAPLSLSLRGGGPPPCRAHANQPTLFPGAWWGSTARRAARIPAGRRVARRTILPQESRLLCPGQNPPA